MAFTIPESLKLIPYGTSITSSTLNATITNTLTSTPVSYGQVTYTLSATDMSKNIVTNSVLNAGTYYIYAQYIDPSNIYINRDTFTNRSNTVTVTKVKSIVTTPNISSVVYGTTMDGFISGTTTSVPGSLKFYTPDNA